MKREFIFTIAFILVLLFFLMRTDKVGTNNDVVKIDSTKVEIFTPKDSGQFVSKKPKPIIIEKKVLVSDSIKYQNLLKTLEIKYNKKAVSVTLLKELLEAKKIREYKQTYEDSLVIAKLYERVEGTLLERRFSYVLKPQKITYYNKTTTIERYPDYALYVGTYFNSTTQFTNSVFGVNVSYQGKNGNIFSLGYGTNNAFQLSFKKQLFVKF